MLAPTLFVGFCLQWLAPNRFTLLPRVLGFRFAAKDLLISFFFVWTSPFPFPLFFFLCLVVSYLVNLHLPGCRVACLLLSTEVEKQGGK
ncbi:hypothetical protein RIF29_42140 [Crotalaria pallida]|uniref:Uncharacterized protein n=1 Tax=Crotalaria pallida TaxID=3830 RepID=A0AAN9HQ17_CROPI